MALDVKTDRCPWEDHLRLVRSCTFWPFCPFRRNPESCSFLSSFDLHVVLY